MEGGIGGLALSSGQQAISVALWNLVHAGGHIISAAALYGGTITLFAQTFKRLGIDVTFVDAKNPKDIAAAVRPNTRAVYVESLANPQNDVLDYKAIADAAHQHGLPVARGSSSSPSSRCSRNRRRHLPTVCRVTRQRLATSLLSTPCAHASTMREHNANACEVLCRRVHSTNWLYSCMVNFNSTSCGPLRIVPPLPVNTTVRQESE